MPNRLARSCARLPDTTRCSRWPWTEKNSPRKLWPRKGRRLPSPKSSKRARKKPKAKKVPKARRSRRKRSNFFFVRIFCGILVRSRCSAGRNRVSGFVLTNPEVKKIQGLYANPEVKKIQGLYANPEVTKKLCGSLSALAILARNINGRRTI